MIHHISLCANDPGQVARVLAALIGGRAFRFPGPLPDAFMAVSGDPHGTMIEVYAEDVVMEPGSGDAPVEYRRAEPERRFVGAHALLSVPHDLETVERIGAAAGWRTRLFARARPGQPAAFHVVELWVENRILLEIVPAGMIEVYERYMQPERLEALGLALADTPAPAILP